MANKDVMEPLLIMAVPMWIEKLKYKSFKDFEARREKILESVCYKGDLLLYGSKKKGETAELFNDLAEGLAWLALIAKGGVTFGDLHWDAEFESAQMSDLPKEDHGPLKSEEVPVMCEGTLEKTGREHDAKSDCNGKETGGENG